MHIVAVAWIFVVVLMAAAEAGSSQGTVLGAIVTLLLYGALPLWIVMYLLGTPARKQARLRAERARDDSTGKSAGPPGPLEPGTGTQSEAPPSGLADPDSRGLASGDAVPSVGKEP